MYGLLCFFGLRRLGNDGDDTMWEEPAPLLDGDNEPIAFHCVGASRTVGMRVVTSAKEQRTLGTDGLRARRAYREKSIALHLDFATYRRYAHSQTLPRPLLHPLLILMMNNRRRKRLLQVEHHHIAQPRHRRDLKRLLDLRADLLNAHKNVRREEDP